MYLSIWKVPADSSQAYERWILKRILRKTLRHFIKIPFCLRHFTVFFFFLIKYYKVILSTKFRTEKQSYMPSHLLGSLEEWTRNEQTQIAEAKSKRQCILNKRLMNMGRREAQGSRAFQFQYSIPPVLACGSEEYLASSPAAIVQLP